MARNRRRSRQFAYDPVSLCDKRSDTTIDLGRVHGRKSIMDPFYPIRHSVTVSHVHLPWLDILC